MGFFVQVQVKTNLNDAKLVLLVFALLFLLILRGFTEALEVAALPLLWSPTLKRRFCLKHAGLKIGIVVPS